MQNRETNSAANFPQSSTENRSFAIVPQVPAPDNPPWNSLAAIGIWVASIIFIAVIPAVFLIPYLAKQHLNFANQEAVKNFALTDPTAVLIQIISIIPAHILTLVLAWLVVTNLRKYSLRQTLGFEWNGFKIWHSIVIVIFFLLLAFALTKIFGQSDNDFQKMMNSSRFVVFPVAFMAVFTAPIVEEVIYRGILYSALQRKVGVWFAVIIVTLLFGLVHVPQYSKNFSPDFSALIPLFLLSLTLTLIRVRTKNLLPCIVLHTMFNFAGSIALILEPYLREQVQKTSDPVGLIFHLIK